MRLNLKTRSLLALSISLFGFALRAETTTTVDTAIKTDERGRVPQVRTTVKTIDSATSRELKRVTKITDFNLADTKMLRLTKTVENFDPRTGEKVRVTFVETKRDPRTGAPVRTIAVAHFDPVTKQLVSKGSSIEYADANGKFYRPEPSEDVAFNDDPTSGSPVMGRHD